MANIGIPMQAMWDKWCSMRSQRVVEAGKRIVPWKLYLDRGSGLRCVVRGFHEDASNPSAPVTAICDFLGAYNLINFERRVHGIPLDDLEECELPGSTERTGVTMSDAERLAYINAGRQMNGLKPLTEQELQDFLARADPGSMKCVMGDDVPTGEDHGEDEGKEEIDTSEIPEQGKEFFDKAKLVEPASQADTDAVPTQEAGASDDKAPDNT